MSRTAIPATTPRRLCGALAACCSLAFLAPVAAALDLHEIDQFLVPPNATMMLYSPSAGALVFRNAAGAVVVVDIATRASATRLPHWQFTDIAMSPGGHYAFAADYGGENIGYGTPLNTSYVHRIDLAALAWEERTAYIAGNVAAVSDTQVILKSLDQWVTFTNNAWGSGTALIPLNTGGYWGPSYGASVFAGDFRYDVLTGRLLHGNSNLSSQEIQAFRISNNEFVKQEGTGTYGSAQGYGGTVVLATDGSAFYYGRLRVDSLDATHNTQVFREPIHAANGRFAFGNRLFFDARTGAQLGTLPFQTTVYAMNPQGDDFWALDPATSIVHHFLPDPTTATAVSSSVNPAAAGQSLTFTAAVTSAGGTPSGMVEFKDGLLSLGTAALSGGVASYTTSVLSLGNHTITASYGGSVGLGESTSLPLAQSVLAAPSDLHDVEQIPMPTNATRMLYSPGAGALVLKNSASAAAVVDVQTRASTEVLASSWFKDISISPSGRYAFAADYGGENIGYGTPASTSYVHRVDLLDGTRDIRTAYIAGNVAAVSDTQVILKSLDQWVTFTNNAWGIGTALIPLNTPSGYWGPGYYPGVFDGDFRYDANTARLIHGDLQGSQKIQAFTIVNNEFVEQEGSGNSAQGYGGTVALATDGSAFYYGKLQVDPLDINHHIRVFPEMIFAANGAMAFGNGTYYDVHTGAVLGALPFQTTVYAMNPQGADFWAFEPATTTVHHFAPGAPTTTTVVSSANPSGVGQAVTFTATVAAASGTPAGTVVFRDGPTTLGSAALSAGAATYETSALSLGSHTITASYLGSNGFALSTSPALTQSVLAAPRLTVTKLVVNDNGGTKRVSDFPLFVDGNQVLSGAQNSFSAGAHTVSETPGFGYSASIGGDCAADGSITLGLGVAKACTITNDDVAPKLTVTKVVVNDNGGTKQVGDFPLFVDGTRVTSGVQNGFNAGSHTVSETSSPNYAATFSGDCAPSGSVTLNPGDVKACTITNNDLKAPDVTVSSLLVPSAAVAGSTIAVTDTTQNLAAAGTAGASTTRFYLSANSAWDGADVPLGGRAVPGLAPGASSSVTTPLTIPPGTATAIWYVIARADGDGALTESSETNNTRSAAIRISPPDLVVSAFSAPAAGGAGLSITVTDTTRNQTGVGPASPSTTKFYLSADSTWDGGDTLLGSRTIGALAPGVVSSGPTPLTIPAATAAGTWYIVAKADADNGLAETSESNNTASDRIAIGPDLVVSAFTAPATGGAGLPITVTDTTKNQGGGQAAGSTTRFYLSADSTLSADDLLLGSRSVGTLNPNAVSTVSSPLGIPAGTPIGAYYVLAVCDAAGVVRETNETNNTAASLIRLSPDLIVPSLSMPTSAAAGATITVTDMTRNQGLGSAAATTTTFYLSANTAWEDTDVPLKSRNILILASGASSAASTSVTIPVGTAPGAWYILARADSANAVAETSETNNTASKPITITP